MSGNAALVSAGFILLVPTLVYIAVVWLADKNEKEPVIDILAAVVAGAAAAPLLTVLAERALGIPASIYPPKLAQLPFAGPNLAGALVEEIAKAAVLLVLFFAMGREFDNVMDGIVYGALVGAGFALAENVVYLLDLARLQDVVRLSVESFWATFMGGLSQCVFSAIFGASLGLIREWRVGARYLALAPLPGLALAILYHMAYIQLGQIAAGSGVLVALSRAADWGGLAFLAGVVGWAWHHEAAVIHAMLADEVESGAVTPAELTILETTGARAANELHIFATGGIRAFLLARSLHQAQVELAFRKWHLANAERLKGVQRDSSDEEYRARIAALRDQLQRTLARVGPAGAPPGR